MFQNVPECSRMCRDQNLISATDGADGADGAEHTKIEKRGVGRPLLGPAKIKKSYLKFEKRYFFSSLLHMEKQPCL